MSNSLKEIVKKLNAFAPEKIAEDWDNVGLLIAPATSKPIAKIILTNDLTEKVLYEAVQKRCDLIISYHPLINAPFNRITQDSWKSRIVSVCLENRIAVYSPHSSWDKTRGAIGDWLARALPHTNSRFILPHGTTGEFGLGRIADVDSPTPITLADAIEHVKRHTGIKTVQVSIAVNHSLETPIRSFAVCPGAGSTVVRGVKADLYITGEMTHSNIHEAAHNSASVILCNQSNSERGFLHEFKGILANLLEDPSIEIILSETDADPLVTY